MKGGGEKTVTQSVDPQTQKMRQEVFDRARGVANQPYTPYTGQQVAGYNPYMNQGAQAMGGVGNSYGDLYGAARNFGLPGNMSFGSGLSLNGSPYSLAGDVNARALGGDPNAIHSLMNPYIDQVINAAHGQYDKLRSQSALGSNDAATRAGAFGGDRAALMKGARLGEIDSAEGQNAANLLSGGYSDMMNRALSGAGLGANYALGVGGQQLQGQGLASQYALGRGNLGLGALGAANQALAGQLGAAQGQFGAGLGYRDINQQMLDANRQNFNEQRDWGLRGLNVLSGSLSGMPYGTQSSEPLQRNAFAGAAGGALTGAQLAGPWGALAGGLGGLLFG